MDQTPLHLYQALKSLSTEKIIVLHMKTPVFNQAQSMKIQRLMTQGQGISPHFILLALLKYIYISFI